MKDKRIDGKITCEGMLQTGTARKGDWIFMEKQGKWLLCPVCRSKTRVWVREDTILQNFLLFCPKCKQEQLIDVKQYQMTILSESQTQRRRDV